jgi:hypothetical protein
MASKQPLSTFLFIGHSDEEIEDIPIREDRTYNIRPRHLRKVTGANIPTPLRGGIIGLGKSYRKACNITLTAGKATGQLYPRACIS